MNLDLTVAGYLINPENKILLIHHTKLDLWLPVGGHIEVNETPDDALKREFREEVGLDIKILSLEPNIPEEGNIEENLAIPFYTNTHSVGDHMHYGLFFVCSTDSKTESLNLEEGKIKNFQWFSKEELDTDPKIPVDVKNQGKEAFNFYYKLNQSVKC